MTVNTPAMIDMVFDLQSTTLPHAYPFALWEALLRHSPQLTTEKSVGVMPIRATESKEGLFLTKRSKLVLRLPTEVAEPFAAGLTGKTLQLGAHSLPIGKHKSRAILPFPTLHGQLVTGVSDEVQFTADIKGQLSEMGIAANLICGKRHSIIDERHSLQGYSLVIHDLKPDASLQLQYVGLGENRQFGCGIFIPYKVISGLSDD